MPMRHRKVPPNWDVVAPVSRPLASAVLDLMVIDKIFKDEVTPQTTVPEKGVIMEMDF